MILYIRNSPWNQSLLYKRALSFLHWKALFQRISSSFFLRSCIDFLFPRTCIVCEHACEENQKVLCASCFSDLFFIPLFDRCHLCFQSLYHSSHSVEQLHRCPFRKLKIDQYGFCFEKSRTLLHLLYFFEKRRGDAMSMASLASFFAIQYTLLHFIKPDLLILIPSERSLFTHSYFAKELCSLLKVGSCSILNKKKQRLDPLFRSTSTDFATQKRALCISEFLNPYETSSIIMLIKQHGVGPVSWISLYD